MAEPNFVQIGGSEYSLTGLVTVSPLQDLLRGLAAAISTQQRSIEHVRLELQVRGPCRKVIRVRLVSTNQGCSVYKGEQKSGHIFTCHV